MRKALIVEGICYYFFLLFIYTALSKWMIFPLFINDLARAPLTSISPIFFAVVVPALELIVAIMVLFQKTRKLGLYGALALMLAFTIYVGYVLGMTTERPCSCGGIFRDMTWPNHLYFNSASTVLALIGIWLNRKASLEKRNSSNNLIQLSSD